MNILYLHSHDTGRMIAPYGYGVESPHLQELAASSCVFRQAFTVNPTCSPSRCALLTGQYAHRCGMLGLAHRGFRMPDYSRHLAAVLRGRGYETVLSGIQHETDSPEIAAALYERNLTPGGAFSHERDGLTAEAAEGYLRSRPSRPFFLSVGFFATHRDFPRAGRGGCVPEPFPNLPHLPQVREDMADYQASLDVLDRSMGRVLRALKESGAERDTVVLCTTDHGPAFPGMKCTMRDDGLGVMLMLRIPGEPGAGKSFDAITTHLDVVPTLGDLLGLNVAHALDGKSLLPLIRGEQENLHEAIFAETNFHAAYEPQRAVRTARWKYIRRFGSRRTLLPNIDDGPTKTALFEAGKFEQRLPEEQLFDVQADPGETTDLATRPGCQEELSALRSRLRNWQVATDDPLLDGPLTAPPHARVTGPDCYSPSGNR